MFESRPSNMNPPARAGAAVSMFGAAPMPDRFGRVDHQAIYVTRYCSLGHASLGAAIRDGFAVLKAYTASNHQVTCRAPLLVIRNKRESTATLDIYLPIEGALEALPGGEIRLEPALTQRAVTSGGRGSLGEFLEAAAGLDDASAWLLDETPTERRAVTTH